MLCIHVINEPKKCYRFEEFDDILPKLSEGKDEFHKLSQQLGKIGMSSLFLVCVHILR